MTTTMRKRPTVKPVSGVVRWLRPLIVGKQLGRIAITNASGKAEEYDIAAFRDGDGVIQGFGLAKDDDEIRAIDVTMGHGWTCDCPDSEYRNRECKHVKAVRAALTQAGIDVPQPKRQEPPPERRSTCEIEFDDP